MNLLVLHTGGEHVCEVPCCESTYPRECRQSPARTAKFRWPWPGDTTSTTTLTTWAGSGHTRGISHRSSACTARCNRTARFPPRQTVP